MFLQLYNKSHEKVAGLAMAKAAQIESVLSTGDKTLSFLYPLDQAAGIVNEAYLRTEVDEFVIKEVLPDSSNVWVNIKAVLNVEALQGQCWPKFESIEQKIDDCLTLAIAGTGWTIGSCTVTKRRTLRKTGCSTWEIISQAIKSYNCNVWFDSLKKQIHISEKRGQDKGVYFTDNLNLKKLSIQSTSHDFCTRIRAEGKDGLTFENINGGKSYVENHQYSNKIITIYWKDERYTVAENLLEDATAKLEALSKPIVAYSGEIIDLAKAHPETYTILDFGLGDTVELIDSTTGTKEKQRIVKMVEYPDEPEKNTCEFANRTASFEELQQEQNEVNSTVGKITSDDGTISPSALDLDAITIHVQNIYAQELNAVKARIGELETTTLKATEAIISTAKIEELLAGKATILDFNAVTARIEVAEIKVGYIDTLVSDVADIRTLVNGNLTSVNIQAGGITSDSLTIRNGFITNAMIGSVAAGKITAGILNTAFVEVQGTDGRMAIKDNTIQIKDANRVRVQIGKDATGDYSMYVWDAAGSLMFDATGLHAPGIKSGIIRNDMVANNANIAGTKIDITSLITSINGNTTKIDSTVIKMDSGGQTLNLAFNSLKTTVETTKSTTETHTTQINTVNGKIDTLIQDTTIVRDGQTLKLKDEYNKTVATVGGIQTTIGNQQTTITNLGNQLSINEQTKLNGIELLPQRYLANSISGYAVKQGNFTVGVNGSNSIFSSGMGWLTTDYIPIDNTKPIYWAIDYINTGGGFFYFGIEQYKSDFSSGANNDTSYMVSTAGDSARVFREGWIERLYATTAYIRLRILTGWSGGATSEVYNRIYKLSLKQLGVPFTTEITETKSQQATFQQTLNGFSTTISSLQTTVNGKVDAGTVSTLNSRVSSLETNLDGFKTTVSSTYATKTQLTTTDNKFANYSTTAQMNSAIDQKANQITLNVSQTYTTKSDFTNLSGNVNTALTNANNAKAYTDALKNGYGYIYRYDVVVKGASNIYYPVIIKGGNQSVKRDILVVRGYTEQAPSDWNTATHKGDLSLKIKTNFGSWGGANYSWAIHELEEMYCRMFAGAALCGNACMFAIFLRGGGTTGAIYHLFSDQQLDANCYAAAPSGMLPAPQICYNSNLIFYSPPYTAYAPAPRTLTAAVEQEIKERLYIKAAQESVTKIATLETNVDGITGRVTNVESKATTTATGLTNLTTRVSTAESKLTATSLITTFTTAINGGTKFTTTKFTMDNMGLTVKGGGIRIQNNAGANVLYGDTSGNLVFGGTLSQVSTSTQKTGIEIKNGRINMRAWQNGDIEAGSFIGYGGGGVTGVNFAMASGGQFGVVDSAGNYKILVSTPLDNVQVWASWLDAKYNLNVYGKTKCSGNVISKFGHENNIFIGSDYIYSMLLSGNPNWYIHCNTNIGAYGINIWASDGRMKTNIQPTQITALDEIARFKHRAFQWKDGGQFEKIGYIAQELEQINPEYVERIPQKDKDGNILDYRLQINEHRIIPLLTKAVQELTEENKELRRQIQYILQKTGIGAVPQPVNRMARAAEYIPQYPENIRYYVPPEPNPEPVHTPRVV